MTGAAKRETSAAPTAFHTRAAGGKSCCRRWIWAHALEQGSETIDKIYDVISERIAAREQDIQAFTSLDLERSRSAAHAVCGPLRGLPLAVKDNIETGDHPTAYGSPIHTGHQPAVDAVSVALADAPERV